MRKLGQKNLCYSLLLAAVLLLLLTGYFIWMLPSLYVSYTQEQNLEAVKMQHQAFLETGTYNDIRVKNPAACVSFKIPYETTEIELTMKMVSVKIMASDPHIKALLNEIQLFLKESSAERFTEPVRERVNAWRRELAAILQDKVQLPFQIQVLSEKQDPKLYYEEKFRIHSGAGGETILEAAVSDRNNQYTNYLAVEKVQDGIVFTLLPVITPQMEEIRPIVLQSVPMLCAVVVMLVLIFSQIYSNGIVQPVYQRLQDSNQKLLEENERQEMFLRASSHQMKTPITASLLLLDGMIGKIGKYSDRETYLPKVKQQLLSMRTMVEEILSLNQNHRKADFQNIRLHELVRAQTDAYRVAAADKHLEITIEGEQDAVVCADAESLSRIIDNLLSNAVAYTPCDSRIAVSIFADKLVIRNTGAAIPPDLLPHIFEPFVHGEGKNGSHGLGLYIAAYYAKMMHMRLNIRNQDNGVEAVLQTIL